LKYEPQIQELRQCYFATKTAICRASITIYKRLLFTQEVQEALVLTRTAEKYDHRKTKNPLDRKSEVQKFVFFSFRHDADTVRHARPAEAFK
jgi:hypothetical protein